jgi:hypothetical protein
VSEAAVQAYEKAVVTGDAAAATKTARWLLDNHPLISARFDLNDVESAVLKSAAGYGSRIDFAAAIARLAESLEEAPGTVLIGLFQKPVVAHEWTLGNVRIGPAATVLDADEFPAAEFKSVRQRAGMAIRVDEAAAGMRGARHALQSVRACIGALYLAGRTAGADTRVGPVPGDGFTPSIFVGVPGELVAFVEAMRIPESAPLELEQLLSDPDHLQFIEDCLRPSDDFITTRLRSAAAWAQIGFDALAYPDAVLALGIALEALVGSEGSGDTVKTVSTRVAFLLRHGATPEDRTLSAFDWRNHTRSVYDERSAVAHGRYAEGEAAKEGANRRQFEDLVCRVAVQFREVGREKTWTQDKDLKKWQEMLELG